jgi:hypothetical protein
MNPTTAEDEAGAALRASKAINQGQQVLTEESRILLAALLRDEMRVAVAEGISAALTDDALWKAVVKAIQDAAVERTGRFVLGGLTSILSKLGWVALAALALYAVGGFAALKAAWVAMFGRP